MKETIYKLLFMYVTKNHSSSLKILWFASIKYLTKKKNIIIWLFLTCKDILFQLLKLFVRNLDICLNNGNSSNVFSCWQKVLTFAMTLSRVSVVCLVGNV